MGSYEETLGWMYKQLPMFQRQGPVALKLDLSRMYALLELLGNPHEDIKYIHIAGTNGKGTNAHVIASVLQASGLQIGMYTSPHYKDFRERIKINGGFIEKSFVVDFIETNKELFKAHQPSFFELTFLMAISYFKAKAPDLVILETGMGGRLDSTNVVDPLICLITNIGYDHQKFLGDSLPEIAFEKGGIIKPEVPVVIGEYQEEVAYVFKQISKELNAPLAYAEDSVTLQNSSGKLFLIEDGEQFEIPSDIQGPFRERNLRSSIALLKRLSIQEPALFTFDLECIQKGLKQVVSSTYYIGRWSIQSSNPLIIFDSAHNKEGMTDTFEKVVDMNQGQLHIVFATVADKDLKPVLSIFPKEAKYYLTKADIPRAMNESILAEEFAKEGLNGRAFSNSAMALVAAKEQAKIEDTILVVGSIFLIAELI